MHIKFIRRLFLRPAKRLGRTFINLLLFDIASTVYAYSKGWFRESGTKKSPGEDEVEGENDINWNGLKKRRW